MILSGDVNFSDQYAPGTLHKSVGQYNEISETDHGRSEAGHLKAGNELLVAGMGSDPEPDNQSLCSHAHGPVITCDPDGVDRFGRVYLFESQARMVRIVPKTGVSSGSLNLDGSGKIE